MDVGAVGFHDQTKVKRVQVIKDQSIVNQLNKTKEVELPTVPSATGS